MRGPTDDFTEIEEEFLRHAWVESLRETGSVVDDDLREVDIP